MYACVFLIYLIYFVYRIALRHDERKRVCVFSCSERDRSSFWKIYLQIGSGQCRKRERQECVLRTKQRTHNFSIPFNMYVCVVVFKKLACECENLRNYSSPHYRLSMSSQAANRSVNSHSFPFPQSVLDLSHSTTTTCRDESFRSFHTSMST
jgi:hypothetical protein